ncbi:hypothetical protein KSS87_008302, partial [Heliosperma pusillum]
GAACRNFYGIKLSSQTNYRRRWSQCVASAHLVSVGSAMVSSARRCYERGK